MENKNIAEDFKILEQYIRSILTKDEISEIKSKYVSFGSFNWFGFLERINECIEAPRWVQIRSFVEYYCKKQAVSATPYLNLYINLEDLGYSPVFKTDIMKSLYLNSNDITEINGIYKEIFDFFEKNKVLFSKI